MMSKREKGPEIIEVNDTEKFTSQIIFDMPANVLRQYFLFQSLEDCLMLGCVQAQKWIETAQSWKLKAPAVSTFGLDPKLERSCLTQKWKPVSQSDNS